MKLAPTHPGEILREEFLVPLGLSAEDLARRIGVLPALVEGLANETIDITADTALRLAKAFGTTPEL